MRTIIIGDIHGCYEQLKKLLKKVDFQHLYDRIIFLGDYIDRGLYSYEVINEIVQMQRTMGERCIALCGNHEAMMLNAIVEQRNDDEAYSLWKHNGGGNTMQSFSRHNTNLSSLKTWLRALPLYYETEEFICVHAGINLDGLRYTQEDTFLWDRSMVEYGWYKGKLLFCGHTPVMEVTYQDGIHAVQIMKQMQTNKLPRSGIINLDTGCVFGYKLSAIVIENGEFEIHSVFWEDNVSFGD